MLSGGELQQPKLTHNAVIFKSDGLFSEVTLLLTRMTWLVINKNDAAINKIDTISYKNDVANY